MPFCAHILRSIVVLCVLIFCVSFHCHAQADSTLYAIETIDGNEFVGYIIYQDSDVVKLNTAVLGEVEIKREMIKSIKVIDEKSINEGEYWPENVQSTTYFVIPSAFGLREGEGYYQNTLIVFNQVSVGVTKEFSVGVGTMPLILFGAGVVPFWVTPKISIPIQDDQFNLGVGVIAGTAFGDGFGGLAYGIGTIGNRDNNISIGVGYGFSDGGWGKLPSFNFSGLIRTGKKGYIITENWFFGTGGDSNYALFSLGGRRMLKRASIDFGLIIPGETGVGYIAFPMLGMIFPFGKDIERAVPNVYFENK